MSTSDFLTLLGYHWGRKGERIRAKNASTLKGTGVGALNPPESTHSILDPGWSTAGLHKSLSPLAGQEAQPGPSPSH